MFYKFRQNNSGGTFIFDDKRGLSVNVWVEADDLTDACNRAEKLGVYFNGVYTGYDCECCGDRWYKPCDDGQESAPTYVEGYTFNSFPLGFVHFKDGTFKPLPFKKLSF